jgi:outer membrane protein assembly factor BamD (BamD/ComL family)
MGYSTFTEEQITTFIEHAQEMGIGPAIRYIGYPKSYHTAKKWFEQRSLDMPTMDTLAKMAVDTRAFYNDKEKLIAAQAVLDRCVETLMQDSLDPDELNKLANAVHKAIQTINLIEGKSTVINENRQKDGQDLAIIDLLNEAKMRNEAMKKNGLVNDGLVKSGLVSDE